MKITTDEAVRAIRAKCLDCSGGSKTLVERCIIRNCPLYPYRNGEKQPAPRRELKGQITMNFKEKSL